MTASSAIDIQALRQYGMQGRFDPNVQELITPALLDWAEACILAGDSPDIYERMRSLLHQLSAAQTAFKQLDEAAKENVASLNSRIDDLTVLLAAEKAAYQRYVVLWARGYEELEASKSALQQELDAALSILSRLRSSIGEQWLSGVDAISISNLRELFLGR